jgi:DNA invertase Pin-like site-specific DNA recombinase
MENTTFTQMGYRDLVSMARENGMENAHKSTKEALIEFLTGLQATPTEPETPAADGEPAAPKAKREKKAPNPKILEMGTGEFTRREIAKACGCSYSDVYFALKAAGLQAKAVKKPKDLADAAAEKQAEPAEIAPVEA